MDSLVFQNKIRKFLRAIGIHMPHLDPTLTQDYMLGFDYSEEPYKPSLSVLKTGDTVKNILSGKKGVVYMTGSKDGVFFAKVRWPKDFNVVYCDNGFDGYLLKKV